MKKDKLLLILGLFLLIPSVATAEEKNPFEINSDIIYQEEGETNASEYSKIRSQLFLERQNNKNARVQEEENEAVYGMKDQLFIDGQAGSDESSVTTDLAPLFQEGFQLEENFTSTSSSQSSLDASRFSIVGLTIGAFFMVVLGWFLGKNKLLKAKLSRRIKHE